jgi:ABC-type glutathione transport system ATPase component
MGKCFTSGFLQKKQRWVLREVSFTIYTGETLGLIGVSGSGKTTLARLMAGLIRPTTGRVVFDGTTISGKKCGRNRPVRKALQIVFQNPETAFNPKMKLKDSMAEPLRIHGKMARKAIGSKVMDMARDLALPTELLERYPHQLSGGQIQRAVLARLLCINPRLIILDEPTSMLDVSCQAQILSLLKEIQQASKMAYMFISHDLEVVAHMSDNIGVLHGGRLVEYGAKQQVLEAPRHHATRYLVQDDWQAVKSAVSD